jgi:large subunit ribosomal protein L18
MSNLRSIQRQRQRRRWSVRNKIRRFGSVRLRLSVFRSNRHIYAQVIDDLRSITVVAASTCESPSGKERVGSGGLESAEIVGARLARRCLELGISSVVFDRGCYKFHGRVAAIAAGARSAGLEF